MSSAPTGSGYVSYRVSCFDLDWNLIVTDVSFFNVNWDVHSSVENWDNSLPTRLFSVYLPLGAIARINAQFSIYIIAEIGLSLVVNL